MKRNLVKILALSAIVLTLGACNKNGGSSEPSSTSPSSTEPSGPAELTILEVFELNQGNFLHEGEEITLKQQCVYGNYGTTYIVGVAYEQAETILDFKGLEVELDATPNWQGVTLGRYANVDVTGTLENVNGRPVLKNASLVINAEARYDETTGDRIDGDGAFSAGYWGKTVFKRDHYDDYLGRNMNGTMLEGIFQLASKPGEISATSGSSFYVVFPGEDTDATDENNESLVYVELPVGLDETAVNAANTFFATANVGDFIDMMGITRWDSTKGGMGILAENWWGKRTVKAAADDIPTIYKTWTAIKTAYEDLYENPFLDLAPADENDALGAPFSYLVDDEDYAKNPRDYWVDDYKDTFCTVSNPAKCGLIKITANYKPAQKANYKAAVEAKLVALGYESAGVVEGYEIYNKKSGEDIVAGVLFVPGDSYASIYYTALRIITDEDFASLALAKASYEGRLSQIAGAAFPSALPEYASEQVANVNFSWKDEGYYYTEYNIPAFVYSFEFSFAKGATTEQKNAVLSGLKSALTSAGFAEDYFYSTFSAVGMWNATSKEFILGFGLSKNGTIVLEIAALFGSQPGKVIPKPTSDAELLAMVNGEYAGWNGASAEYFPTVACSLTSFTLGELAAIEWSCLDTEYDDMDKSHGYTPMFSAVIKYSRDLVAADLQALASTLSGLGFVSAAHSSFGDGYFNATTYEFIAFSAKGAELTIMFALVPVPLKATVITIK